MKNKCSGQLKVKKKVLLLSFTKSALKSQSAPQSARTALQLATSIPASPHVGAVIRTSDRKNEHRCATNAANTIKPWPKSRSTTYHNVVRRRAEAHYDVLRRTTIYYVALRRTTTSCQAFRRVTWYNVVLHCAGRGGRAAGTTAS